MEFENREIEVETIAENIEQKLMEGANSKNPCLVVGMSFNDEEELREYYKNHAKEEGFGITTRSSHGGADGKVKYLTLTCCRSGKYQSQEKNPLHPQPSAKTGFKARICASLCADGKFAITRVAREHNHSLSPGKARYYTLNKKMDPHVKRRLELNDEVGIKVNKNFYSLVVQTGGYDNLTFGEKDCRNYLDKARRLRLGIRDAEAI